MTSHGMQPNYQNLFKNAWRPHYYFHRKLTLKSIVAIVLIFNDYVFKHSWNIRKACLFFYPQGSYVKKPNILLII